jgi:hypothetical protein
VLGVTAVFVVAALVSFPISFVGAMMLTPVLYRLEPALGMELAGHSGPSDWIMMTVFGITTIAVAGAILWLRRLSRREASPAGEESAPPPTA